MNRFVRQFVRTLSLCWLPIFLGIEVLLVALATRGETIDFTRANTWLALGMSLAFSSLWAILPALGLAALVTAVVFKRNAVRGGTWPNSKASHISS